QRTIPGPGGDLALRIYRPQGNGPFPLLVFFHGSGFVLCSLDTHDGMCRNLCAGGQCIVVSVDYRLAPETPFPGPQEDCYAALEWLSTHAAELGVDPARIVVIGESAGGGLSAALAQMVRDRAELQLAGQALIYPMLDYRTGSPASPWHNPYAGQQVWTAPNSQFGWASLRGDYAIDDHRKGWFSPAMADDLTGLAPAFVSAAALDLLVDEDIDYARRLNAAGVAVEAHLYPGAFHGFDGFDGARVSRAANAHLEAWLARQLYPED
ncbi:MAG TPA: alpha/beta hydrolase, partial [Novosphingobium sp.]